MSTQRKGVSTRGFFGTPAQGYQCLKYESFGTPTVLRLVPRKSADRWFGTPLVPHWYPSHPVIGTPPPIGVLPLGGYQTNEPTKN